MPYDERYLNHLYDEFLTISRDLGEIGGREMIKRLIEWHDQERAIGWNTTCRGCADLLDKLYERDVRDGNV